MCYTRKFNFADFHTKEACQTSAVAFTKIAKGILDKFDLMKGNEPTLRLTVLCIMQISLMLHHHSRNLVYIYTYTSLYYVYTANTCTGNKFLPHPNL